MTNFAHYNEVWQEGYDEGQKDAAPKWTPVSVLLPSKDGRYLATRYDDVTRTRFVDILLYEKTTWWDGYCTGDFMVKAWMPLHEPYEEEEND